MSRAENRHYAQRAKARVRQMIRQSWDQPELAANPKFVGKVAHSYPCSCPMCGNPRRHFGKQTIQEIKARMD